MPASMPTDETPLILQLSLKGPEGGACPTIRMEDGPREE